MAQDLSQCLTTLITIAVPEIFLEDFKDSVTGYDKANPRDILSALVKEYRRITGDELEANRKRLKTPWNPDTPIEHVFRNASECRRFALDGYDPISDSQYIQAITSTIKQSGVLASDSRHWKKLPEWEKTVA